MKPITEPEPKDPPVSKAPSSVVVGTRATNMLQVYFHCGPDFDHLVRVEASGKEVTLPNTVCKAGGFKWDTGLTPGTPYCYSAVATSGARTSATGKACSTTAYEPFVFQQTQLTTAESDAMIAKFDWSHTEAAVAQAQL